MADGWEKHKPGSGMRVYEKVLDEAYAQERHERFIAVLGKILPPAAGLLAVAIAAGVSADLIEHNAPIQAAWAFGSTAASLASVFVTQKVVESIRGGSSSGPAAAATTT
jgi:hypothetical protein